MFVSVYIILSLLLFVCLLYAAITFYKDPSWAMAMLLPILAWMIFEPTVIALGNLLGEGALLHVLSLLRHLLRVLLAPFLLLVAFDQAKRAQVRGTQDILSSFGIGILIVVLVIFGFVFNFNSLSLELKEIEGIKRYVEDTTPTVPLATIITLALVALIGAAIRQKIRSFWIAAAGSFALLAFILSVAQLPFYLIVSAYLLLAIGFLRTEQQLRSAASNRPT